MDVMDDVVSSSLPELLLTDSVILQEEEGDESPNEAEGDKKAMDPNIQFDHFDRSGVQKLRPSLEDPPALELKSCPVTLLTHTWMRQRSSQLS